MLAVVLTLYLLQAMSFPADADTLAYHFARPAQILAEGRLTLVPKMVDGITPLLIQMAYLPALAIGGERALMIWAVLTGLAPAAFASIWLRRWLPPSWSLAAALLILTIPGWVFGASGGQVETRLALMVLLSAFALSQAIREPGWRWEVLAGLAAGFYAGGKTLGLVFAAAAGLVLLWRCHRNIRGILAFGLAAALAGAQWYAWNWWQTGDPVFPMLFNMLHLPDSDIWTKAHNDSFHQLFFRTEAPVKPSPGLIFSYPFLATFGLGPSMWEAGRTGLGPVILILLPLAVMGAWNRRHRLMHSPALPLAATIALFYVLWLLSGSSQRIRHLIPMMPAAVMVAMVAAHRASQAYGLGKAFAASVLVALLAQAPALGVFSISYVRDLARGESRDTVLGRSIQGYPVVQWIHSHLSGSDKIMVSQRQWLYLLKIPYYYGSRLFQAQIDLRDQGVDLRQRWQRMRSLGITHIAGDVSSPGSTGVNVWQMLADDLIANGCGTMVDTVTWRWAASRTIPGLGGGEERTFIMALTPQTCGYERP